MKDTTKKCIINCTIGLIGVVSVVLLSDMARSKKAVKPPKIESMATMREGIVTGMCTFGDCPVATTQKPTAKNADTTIDTTDTTDTTIDTTAATVDATEADTDYYTATDEDYSDVDATEPVTNSQASGYIGTMFITGYTGEEGFPEGSATASGYGVRPGYCAMNDSQRRSLGINYGDQIYVDGLGTYTVMDCGCSWGVVDIWVYTNAEASAITGNYAVYFA